MGAVMCSEMSFGFVGRRSGGCGQHWHGDIGRLLDEHQLSALRHWRGTEYSELLLLLPCEHSDIRSMAENLFINVWCSVIVCHGGMGTLVPGVPVTVELLDIEGAPSFEIQLMQRSKLATGFLFVWKKGGKKVIFEICSVWAT
jgi:hypothetical protein